MQSFVFRALGFGLATSRVVPLVSVCVLIATMALYGRRLGLSTVQILTGVLTFLFAPQAFRSCNFGRPDIVVTLFGFASFIVLSIEKRAPSWTWTAIAGGCAGAAMLTHLNGVIFIAAGLAVLVASGHWRKAFAFAGAAALVFSPYALNAASHFDLFKEQLASPLIAYKTHFDPVQPFVNLSREHMRLFRKPDIIFITGLFLVSAVVCIARPRDEDRFVIRYVLALMVALGLFVADKGIYYSVYLVPLQALVISSALMRYWGNGLPAPARVALAVTTVVFMGWGIHAQIQDVKDKDDIVAMNRTIGDQLPRDTWVVAPLLMAFNELERHLLVADIVLIKAKQGHATFDDLAAYCDDKGASFAVVYRRNGLLEGYTDDREARNRSFQTIADGARFIILKRSPATRARPPD
jgi:hypothetical protein